MSDASASSTERYSDYDAFAWIYNECWGDEYHSQILSIFDQILFPDLPPQPHILDLCCGDGRIALHLTTRGYRVSGLDGSEEMLRYARGRLPQTAFYLADARRFTLPETVDCVICTFDSLNHIMSAEDLSQVFRQVHAALKPGGRFVFDLNQELAYRTLWVLTGAAVEADKVYVARGSYDAEHRIATCDVTVFRHDEQWRRSDFRLRQRCHPREEVLQALQDAGFAELGVYDAQEQLGMAGNIGVGRDYFVAVRPKQ